MSETLDDTAEREHRQVGAGILDQRQAGLGTADFRDGGGDGARQNAARAIAPARIHPERDVIDQSESTSSGERSSTIAGDVRLIIDQACTMAPGASG